MSAADGDGAHTLESLEALAVDAATEAGGLILAMLENADVHVATKSSSVDVVTNADRAAESAIIERITRVRSDDAVLGEEGGHSVSGGSGITWVIDPIDGTTNFVYRIPAACVSVAATVEPGDERWMHIPNSPLWHGAPDAPVRRTIAGAIFNPFTNELYRARAGAGASRNGEQLRMNDSAELATALIGTGFGYTAERRREQAEMLLKLLPSIRDIRRLGSAAYDLCLLAQGSLDGYYERGIQEWDFAAGVLIAAEAGARIIGASQDALPSSRLLIAGNSAIADALQSVVGSLASD